MFCDFDSKAGIIAHKKRRIAVFGSLKEVGEPILLRLCASEDVLVKA